MDDLLTMLLGVMFKRDYDWTIDGPVRVRLPSPTFSGEDSLIPFEADNGN